MTLTTGAILRRITEADLSAAIHKLATIILDGITWKDGYNVLARSTSRENDQISCRRCGLDHHGSFVVDHSRCISGERTALHRSVLAASLPAIPNNCVA